MSKLKTVLFRTERELLLTLLLSFILSAPTLWAQRYVATDDGKGVSVTGTSSLHDWEMKLEKMQSEFMVESSGNGTLTGIENLRFTAAGKDLLNGNNTMDRKAHSALLINRHPEITFVQDSLREFKSEVNGYSGIVSGALTTAGISKKVDIPFTAVIEGEVISVEGKIDLKMSDFNIDPPTALLGTLKTGNEITVKIAVKYKKD